MLSHSNRWILVFLAFMFVAALAMLPKPASAAQAATPPTNSCLTCHEDLYYLHDIGKWYCITEHKDRCVNCHEGDRTVLNENESHKGLIIHPQRNNGEKCLECHPQDSNSHLAKFASLGGYNALTETKPYIPPVKDVTTSFTLSGTEPFAENWPWAVGGIFGFGLWLVLVLSSPLKP